MKLWTTTASGTTDASGKYAFRGFQGKYVVTTTIAGQNQIDTIYLEPGQSVKSCAIAIRGTGIAVNDAPGSAFMTIRINGKPIVLKNIAPGKKPLFVSMYSTSGRLLSRRRIGRNGLGTLPKTPAGFYILGIGTRMNNFSTIGISLP
jgi:hypothetical protein